MEKFDILIGFETDGGEYEIHAVGDVFYDRVAMVRFSLSEPPIQAIRGEANLDYDDTNGASKLFDALINKKKITVALKKGVTGDKSYTGSGYLTSLEFSELGTDKNVTLSFELEVLGRLSEVTR